MFVPSLSRTVILIFIFTSVEYLKNVYGTSEEDVVKEYLAARQVYVYRAYKDMQIFHFNIPPYVSKSLFNLTSNNTEGCTSRNITVYLQAKSYPVVSPDGAIFPDSTWVSRQPVYQATLLSDLKPAFLSVVGPQPGDWFMVAFIFDDSNRITQAGLFPSCYAWLQVEASYYQESVVEVIEAQVVANESELQMLSFHLDKPTFFSFFILPKVWSAELVIRNCRSTNGSGQLGNTSDSSEMCSLNVLLRPLALPFPDTPELIEKNCSSDESSNCSLPFTPMPGAWHYSSITPSIDGPISFEIGVSLYVCENDDLVIHSPYPFIFEQEFVFKEMDLEGKLLEAVEIMNSSNSSNSWNVEMYPAGDLTPTSINNIPSSQSKEVAKLILSEKMAEVASDPLSNDLELETDYGNPMVAFHKSRTRRSISSVQVVVVDGNASEMFFDARNEGRVSTSDETCWLRHQLTRKTFPGNFMFEYDFRPDKNGSIPLMVNLSNQIPTILTFEIHPVIDIGGTLSVELALSPFLNTSVHNSSVLGCLTVGMRPSIEEVEGGFFCSKGYVLQINTTEPAYFASTVMIPYPEPGMWFFTLFPSCFEHNQSYTSCSTNVTSVIFSVSSSSCIMGKCGPYGSCFQYISGGFIFSTCVCDVGYRGYACNDDSNAIPNWKLLLSTLLLCLSNLFFLPAILLALYRRFYTEALIYSFTMFFSTFYHACDQDIYNFCLLRLSVLQFCDFYSAILSFWVTLIVMANLPASLHSLLHMAGAVIVALGVEYDRTGLWVFAIPSISALIVMAFAWIVRSKKEKKCYPPRRYWVRCLVPGTVLAAIGLICYAFLETEDNYYIIHSFWHSIMALSILCLLPSASKPESQNSLEDGEYHTSDDQALTGNLSL